MMRPSRRLLLPLLIFAGCVTPDPTPRFTPAWERVDTSGPGWVSTRKALLCADCQFNNLYSQPLPERNLSAEAVAATAIRPPQLDLYSPEVLKWILGTDGAKSDVVIHLGDAANVATTGEFDRFLEVMATSKKPWFMAPGNHDFFYYGIYTPESGELLRAAAHESGTNLLKGRFIRLYVGTILSHDDSGCSALAEALGIAPGGTVEEVAAKLPSSFEWSAGPGATGLLDRICWVIDEEAPWRSFILQSVNIGRPENPSWKNRLFLLDSCQYSRRPGMIPNAWRVYPVNLNCGLTGQMLPDQLRKIREWLDIRLPEEGASFACHHPFEHLEPRTRTNLGFLWREYGIGMMVTAHTHEGYFAHHDVGGESDQIELNIGSTTDWPMEWRTLQAFANEDERRLYVHSDRRTMVEALGEYKGFFQPGWEIPSDAKDDYRMYKQGDPALGLLVSYYMGHHFTPYWLPEPYIRPGRAAVATETQIKDTLLWTYARLLRNFPTDPAKPPEWPGRCASDEDVRKRIRVVAAEGVPFDTKVALLVELEAFERSRRTVGPDGNECTDDVRTRYKISQAVWASRYMKARGRRLRVEDENVRFDWDRTVRPDRLPGGPAFPVEER